MTIIFSEQIVTDMTELCRSWFEKIKWRGGRYKITLHPIYTWPGEMSMDMQRWIKENTKAKVFSTLHHDAFNIFFKSKDEALAFKLRWLE